MGAGKEKSFLIEIIINNNFDTGMEPHCIEEGKICDNHAFPRGIGDIREMVCRRESKANHFYKICNDYNTKCLTNLTVCQVLSKLYFILLEVCICMYGVEMLCVYDVCMNNN